ncbi:hypothetical protein, partial [Gimesia sp.]|uniref:hypothetical protein n=1 Tax=Gimesia sp. TaxID=2024833 RepID=UPI003A959DBE
MLLTNWLKNLFRKPTKNRRNRRVLRARQHNWGRQSAVENLEDRTLLTFVSVLSGSDVAFQGSSGDDSLSLREQDGTGLLEFSTDGINFTTDLGAGSSIAVAAITGLSINGGNNQDTIDLSDLDGLVITAEVTGGHGHDHFITGSADVDFLYSGTNNGSDSFSANGVGDSKIRVLSDNTVVGLASGFNNGVDEIDVADFNNVRVEGTTGDDVLDFSAVAFTNFNSSFQVYGHNNNDTITTSNISAGVRYQGGHGNDHFIIGDADATFIYSGTNNSSDSFTTSSTGLGKLVALNDNTVIGLASGFNDGV